MDFQEYCVNGKCRGIGGAGCTHEFAVAKESTLDRIVSAHERVEIWHEVLYFILLCQIDRCGPSAPIILQIELCGMFV